MAKERNFGIDLLRIVSMLMVVILHILGQGGVLSNTGTLSGQYNTAWFMEIAAYCAVNCYALISGYVGLTAKFKYTNIVYLWLQVTFYTVLIAAITALLLPEVNRFDVLDALMPVTKSYYWYFTAYFAMFFFIPIFNKGIQALTEKQLLCAAAAIILIFSLIPILRKADLFLEKGGYSAIWLMLLYILGGILRKCDIPNKLNGLLSFFLYLVCIFITWLQKLFVERHNLAAPETAKSATLISYISPTILFAGIFLLIAFSKIKVCSLSKKLISFFAPISFGVYIIHVNKYPWEFLIKNRFALFAGYSVPHLIVAVLGTAAGIYIVCSLIDFLRDRLFALFKVKTLLLKCENKLLGDLWNN